jgi:HlyD family secretion protein
MALIPKPNPVSKLVILGSALIVIVLAVVAVRSMTRERISIRTAQVTYQDLVKSFSTNGKVEPDDDFQVHAQATGQIQDVYVDIGQQVKAGQLLLKMEDKYALTNLAHVQSTLQGAELSANDIQNGGSQDERNSFAADLNRATLQRQQDAASLSALRQLQQKGAASASEVAAAEHRIQLDDTNLHSIQQHSTQRYTQADRARAEAEIADARAALAAGQASYETVDVRSKINGTVYYLPVSQYDYVNAGDDLVYIADLNHMRITAYFDEPDIGNLAAGQQVTITWEAKPGVVWHGHITQAPTTIISYLTRFVGECFIAVDDAQGQLQPNANVNVTVIAAQHPHVLSVPRGALRGPVTQPYVFRVVNNRLVRTPVQLGTSANPAIVNLNEVEITGGLSEGDTVALNSTTNRDLTNGLEVTPVQ